MNGWTMETGERKLRRNDFPPEHFFDESILGDPLCAAWDEPGYVDPDLSHENRPLGTRYWQGFAKASVPRISGSERPMSPEWVAMVTASQPLHAGPVEAQGPRETVIREKERDRSSEMHFRFWPG